MSVRNLDRLLRPKAVAFIGASKRPGSIGLVTTRNLRTGKATTNREVLAFRDEQALRASLEHAGFEVGHVYGDWDRRPASRTARELIVVARRVELDT